MGSMESRVITKLKPKQISIEIDRYFKMSREDKVLEFDEFKVSLIHPIYNLAEIASEIANQESRYCYFDHLGYMIVYPEYDIKISHNLFVFGDLIL